MKTFKLKNINEVKIERRERGRKRLTEEQKQQKLLEHKLKIENRRKADDKYKMTLEQEQVFTLKVKEANWIIHLLEGYVRETVNEKAAEFTTKILLKIKADNEKGR